MLKLLFSIIPVVAFAFPLLIVYLLMKRVGIKEAWIGLIVIIILLIFLTFVEITSMYAPTLIEQIRLYFVNDRQMIFYYIYIPSLLSSVISTLMLTIFSLKGKKSN